MTELSLPGKNEFTSPSEEFQDYTILLYGREKIGKTSLASQFPKTFIMLCEPGAKALRIQGRRVNNWKEFIRYIELLEKDKNFQTIVVDTIDLAYRYCLKYVCRKLGVDHPQDEGYGKGWDAVRSEFTLALSRICGMGKGVLFISHSKEMEIKKKNGEKIDMIVPTLANQGRDIIEPLVDIIAYYQYGKDGESGSRILTIRGDGMITAGHRLKKHFLGIDSISMGNSEEEAYRNLKLAFGNEFVPEISGKKKIRIKK